MEFTAQFVRYELDDDYESEEDRVAHGAAVFSNGVTLSPLWGPIKVEPLRGAHVVAESEVGDG